MYIHAIISMIRCIVIIMYNKLASFILCAAAYAVTVCITTISATSQPPVSHDKLKSGEKENIIEKAVSDEANQESEHYEQIVNDYKKYLASVDTKFRDEIIEYRKELREINTKKRELYKKLSQQAQAHLKKESVFRNKLPVETRKKFLKQVYKKVEGDSADTVTEDEAKNPAAAKKIIAK